MRRIGLLVMIGLVLASAGATTALAGDHATEDDTVDVASQDIVVSDAVVRIGGAHLAGPGLPDERIEERTYTLRDATVDIDGLTVVWNDTTYEICHVSITVDDVGVTVHDVTLGDGE